MSKLVSLSDIAYNTLKARKADDESFSDVVLKLVEKAKKPDILALAGKWLGGKAEAERLKTLLADGRKKATMRDVNF